MVATVKSKYLRSVSEFIIHRFLLKCLPSSFNDMSVYRLLCLLSFHHMMRLLCIMERDRFGQGFGVMNRGLMLGLGLGNRGFRQDRQTPRETPTEDGDRATNRQSDKADNHKNGQLTKKTNS